MFPVNLRRVFTCRECLERSENNEISNCPWRFSLYTYINVHLFSNFEYLRYASVVEKQKKKKRKEPITKESY